VNNIKMDFNLGAHYGFKLSWVEKI